MPEKLTRRVSRGQMPLETRLMPLESPDVKERTVQCVFTTGARVQRYDFMNERVYLEELVVAPESVRMDRLNAGAPVLNAHSKYDLRDVIGVVESASIADGQGTATLRFSARAEVQSIFRDIVDGILRSVSVGYVRHRIERQSPLKEGDPWIYRVIDWEPFEISPVPVPADAGAQIRGSESAGRSFDCEFIDIQTPETAGTFARKEPAMPENTQGAPAADPATQSSVNTNRATQTTEAQHADTAAVAAARAEGARLEAERRTQIERLVAVPAVRALGNEFTGALLADPGLTVEAARTRVFDALAAASDATASRSAAHVDTVRDETDVRRAAIVDALVHRMNPGGKLPDQAREYRYMTLRGIAEVCLEAQGIRVRGLAPMDLAARAMSTSDFPNLMSAVVNKRLRQQYDENIGSYRRWARRAPNAPDFKTINVIQLSAAPDLLQVNEGGEFKFGSMSDGKETYAVVTYGRIVPFTRQALINDDLRGLDRLVSAFAASAARLENRTVYAQLTANAAMSDSVALFHATHGNLAGAGAAIASATLGAGRTAMRVQKGLQGEELNLAPAYLIVPATQEQLAYQFTSSQFVPAKPGDVNEFRSGGRTALEPIVEAVLDANSTTAWYLAAANSAVDTVEYCWLEGSEGVYIESEMGFDIDGLKTKARLDFAAKVVDHRGLYKNAGA